MKRVTILAVALSAVIFSVASITARVYAEDSWVSGSATSGNAPTTNYATGTATNTSGNSTGTTGTQATGPANNTTNTGTQSTVSPASGTTPPPPPTNTNSETVSTVATDTTPPIITAAVVDGVTPSAARIRWNTDELAQSSLVYGLSLGNYPYTATARCESAVYVTSHCMYLTNLTPGTLYYIAIISKNTVGLGAYLTGRSLTTALAPQAGGTVGGGPSVNIDTISIPTTQTTPMPPYVPVHTGESLLTIDATILNMTTGTVPANTSGVRVLEAPAALVPQPVAPAVKVISPVSSTAIVPASSLQTPRTQLENVGTSVRTFQNAVTSVNSNVQTAVSRDIERAVNTAIQSQPSMAAPGDQVFDPTQRAVQLAELKQAVNEKQLQLSRDVQATLTSGAVGENPLPNIEPVLKSSLEDIALLIKNQTGVTVDLSPTARTVANDVQEKSAQFDSARQALSARDGLDLYTDSDHDGISDYDEVRIYHTDPRNPYSSGGSITDGEKIVLGFDVSTSTIRRVPVESPMVSGEETKDVFEVYTITVSKHVVPLTTGTSTAATSLSAQATSSAGPAPVLPTSNEKVTFAGRALPNSFITLYIYSTPIVVTVKTDITGAWKYTLDSELPDGNHNLYVATVDSGGKILAKSPAIPFVKTAEAAEFTPLVVSQSPGTDPLDILRNNMMILALAGFAVFAIVALGILGVRRTEPKNNDVASA